MAKKVLIAEDSPTILAIMQEVIASEDYIVLTAEDGAEALQKARAEIPDLIVLDVMLPKMDGYKVCAMLKYDNNYKDIPIIFMTARASEQDKNIGEQVKADAYLTKPFDPAKLLETIAKLIGKA